MTDKPLLDVGDAQWAIIQGILHKHIPDREVWAFGSRAKWTAKEFSDLDLAVIGQKPMPQDVAAALADDFSESDLPWKVDLVDWATTSPSFRHIIERDKVVVQKPLNTRAGWGVSCEWQEVTVGDVSSLVTKGTTPTTIGFGFQDSGIRFVKVETLTEDGHFIEDKFAFISEEANKALLRSQLQEEDVLFTIAGTIGRTGIVKKNHLPANTNQAIAIVRPNRSLIEPRYLRYVLSNPAFTRTAQSKTVQSVQANFSLGELKKAKFQLPPMVMQREILGVLGTLDDRITLLRETNTTLEAIAQALFKSWFVDFDPVHAKMQGRAPEGMDEATAALFPDALEETELGLVPKGWQVGCVEELCTTITNGGTPSRSKPVFWDGGSIPWFKTGEFHDGFLLKPSEFITDDALSSSSVKLLPKDAILMAIYAAPTVGRLGILTEPATFNQACTGMVAKAEIGPWFLFWTLFSGRDWFNSRANGAAQQNISKAIVAGYRVVVPERQVFEVFNESASSLHNAIRLNSEKVQTLSELRDTLLPRLISGQLRLPEAQAQLEDALA